MGMRGFVTGATGCIGSAVVPELIGADPESPLGAAGASDGVIHTASDNNVAFAGDFRDADLRAFQMLGETPADSDPLLASGSATVVPAPGLAGTQQDAPGPGPAAARLAGEGAVLAEQRQARLGAQGAEGPLVRADHQQIPRPALLIPPRSPPRRTGGGPGAGV